jgi:hypothetical protein
MIDGRARGAADADELASPALSAAAHASAITIPWQPRFTTSTLIESELFAVVIGVVVLLFEHAIDVVPGLLELDVVE